MPVLGIVKFSQSVACWDIHGKKDEGRAYYQVFDFCDFS